MKSNIEGIGFIRVLHLSIANVSTPSFHLFHTILAVYYR